MTKKNSNKTDPERIFTAALELEDPAQRSAFLDAACGQDRELRAEVESLLKHDEEAGSFIEQPAVAPPGTIAYQPVTEGAGTTIGPYKLLQKIGEGGFGVVYMAEQQQPVRRKVALKIIKPGMDTREVIARFESERQALALMDHPNIARVLDAGATVSGRPYFVMELVKGVPITEYCDKNNLPTEKRLDLFVTICHAVQHAHQKGIIHRDIKPSNVMITLHDGKPVPKVIDFGVAKATSQQLTEKTLFTAYGQMIGTPVYMSPEQAEMSGLDIDTRSDIYSLGVLLYELLTGTTPFDGKRLREAGYVEMQRIIREEEPPRPSTRVSTLGAALTVVSNHRSTDPGKLRQLLRGDLDLIIMKAMEKERTLRYETPNSFAQDVERFLNHEAILARPQSTLYKLRKFAQRNKAAVASGTAIAAALLLGTIVSTVLAIHAYNQRNQARGNLVALNEQQAETESARKKAVAEAARAKAAEKAESRQKGLADERAKEAEKARMAETELRAAAEQKRRDIEQQKAEIERLNTQFRGAMEEQRQTIYAAEMNLVRLEAQRNNLPRMRELLLRQVPGIEQADLRGFEWSYWYRFLHRAKVVQRFDEINSEAALEALFIVPGGELVACMRRGKTDLIEISTGKVRRNIPARLEWGANRTSLDTSGRMVSGYADTMGTFRGPRVRPTPTRGFEVWDVNGEKRSFDFPDDSLTHVSFLKISPDGRFVAAIGLDPLHKPEKPAVRILAWNYETRELVQNLVESRELNRLQFNADGSRLAAFLSHSTARQKNIVRDVAVVFDLASGKNLGVARHDDDMDTIYFLPDGKDLLFSTLGWSGRNRKELYRWSIGGELRRLGNEYMPDYVQGEVSPDGSLFAVSGHTVSTVRLIDTTTGAVVNTLHNEGTTISSLTFSADGKQLLACGTSGVVLAWDLSQDEDLFRLRADPIDGILCTLSADMSSLAYATQQGGIRLRRRDGKETIVRPDNPAIVGVSDHLLFSPNGKLLVHSLRDRFSSRPSAARPASSIYIHSVDSNQELWTAQLPSVMFTRDAALSTNVRFQGGIHFSADSRRLAVLHGNQIHVYDSATGTVVHSPKPVDSQSVSAMSDLTLQPATGRIVVAQVMRQAEDQAVLHLLDALTGERIAEQDVTAMPPVTQIIIAPDGRHVGLVRGSAKRVEVWDLVEKRQKIGAVGTSLVFSSDGSRAAAVETRDSGLRGTVMNSILRIEQIKLWDTAAGRELSTVSLVGNRADEVRFSPDGHRLLSLHGKRPMSGGAVPEVRLWDVTSGREMMTIPIADVNHYLWDIVFDPTGARFTSIVFAKPSGNGGGWGAVAYDATPLSEAEDAVLVARPLVVEMFQTKLLAKDVIAALEANAALRPNVREAAVALARQRGDRPELVAEACMQVITRRDASSDEYARALALALLYQQLQPNDPLATVLVGAAQYRTGKLAESLATLAKTPSPISAPPGATPYPAEMLRLSFLALASHKSGDIDAAARHYGMSVKERRRIEKADPNFFSTTWSLDSPRGVASEAMAAVYDSISPERYANVMFSSLDENSDGKVGPDESGAAWVNLKPFDRNNDGGVDEEEYVRVYTASRRVRLPVAERLESLNAAILREPNQADLYVQRSSLWLEKSDWENVIKDAGEAIARDANLAQAFHNRGVGRSRKGGDWDAAIKDFDEALRLDAKLDRTYSERGHARRQKGDIKAALQDFDKSIELNPNYGWVYSARGEIRNIKGEVDDAIRDLDRAIELNPGSTAARYYRSRGDMWRGMLEFDLAIKDYSELIRLTPEDAAGYSVRGLCWLRKAEYAKALADFEEILRRDPKGFAGLNNRGAARALAGQYKEALADLDEAFRLNPKLAAIHFWRGYILEKQGQSEQAKTAYESYMQLFPKPADAYRDRANRWLDFHEYDKAIADDDKLLELEPENSHAHNHRGAAHLRKGDYDKALQDFDEEIRLTPTLANGYNSKAWVLATCTDDKVRNGKAAVEAATKACELSQWKNSGFLDTLAAAYAESGDFETAIKHQEQVRLLAHPAKHPDHDARLTLYRAGKAYREKPLLNPKAD